MTGIAETPTMEENIQIPVEQIKDTDALQGRDVEQRNNISGGVGSFQNELSEAEELFNNEENGKPQGISSHKEFPEETKKLFSNNIKPTGYNDFGGGEKLGEESDPSKAEYWFKKRREGVLP